MGLIAEVLTQISQPSPTEPPGLEGVQTLIPYGIWIVALLALLVLVGIGVKMWQTNRGGGGAAAITDLGMWAAGCFVIGIAAVITNLMFF